MHVVPFAFGRHLAKVEKHLQIVWSFLLCIIVQEPLHIRDCRGFQSLSSRFCYFIWFSESSVDGRAYIISWKYTSHVLVL